VWVLLGGETLAAIGNGLTLPFLLVYLVRVRGIEVEVAGLALASLAVAGLVGNPLGGSLSDRIGARRTMVGGLVLVSVGALALVLVREAWHALAAAGVLGFGAAVVWPSQDALLAGLAGPGLRSAAFSIRYATMNLGMGLGSVGGAVIADVSSPRSFEVLFGLQAVGTLLYAAIAARLPDPGSDDAAAAAVVGWRSLLTDRALYGLLPLVTLLFAAGYAQYYAAFPAYATGPGGLGVSALGVAFAANTFTIVAAQLVVFKLVAGWRRSRGLAVVGAIWASAWLVALGAGMRGGDVAGAAMFAFAMALFGLGETVLAPCLGPLVNDLAPDELRGRYNGASALASTAGFIIGPAVAGAALGAGHGGTLVWGLAVACALAVPGALRLERRLPTHANRPASDLAPRPLLAKAPGE
jgi:MFS family permease